MMKKILGFMLSASLLVTAIPSAWADEAGAGDKPTETISYTYSAGAGMTYTREMEKLDRGLVAIKSGSGVFLSWRLFDSEDSRFGSAAKNVSFNIYRGSDKIANISDRTNYTDTTAGTSYSVAPVIDGVEGEKCEAVSVWNNNYIDIPLTKPAGETIYDPSGNKLYDASFFPADCSAGDLDGDGEYEIVVKWTSSERDVGSPGSPEYSGTVHLAAYKLNGTKMWANDIELGKNVYSSAHTVQFLVYDFDGDGKAEITSQTSLGSKDAAGQYVSKSAKDDSVVASTNKKIAEFTDEENASADYRGNGRIVTGEEFLTIFNGETGAAVDTIDLPTARGSAKGVDYGDDFGNRSNRFVSDVAYLDGEKPYAVYLRGYYFGRNGRQRTSIAGVSFDGKRLSPDYRFDTKSGQPGYYNGAGIYVGQGNHNCTVADVDNDGKDEFITGGACYEVKEDNTFKPRWCTFLEHGDALHIGDYDPTHHGLEFFTVHEDGNGIDKDKDSAEVQAKKIAGPDGIVGTDDDYGYIQSNAQSIGKTVICNFGMSVIDADSGEILYHRGNTKDTGRGTMANTGSGGFYQFSGSTNVTCYGNGEFREGTGATDSNFRVFWDGDLYDELLDGTNVTSWNGSRMTNVFSASGCTKINGTKSNPGLQADLFGDWREELVYPTTDGTKLRVFTTTTPTDFKIKTLMHDPVYRSGVAAQQTAYNQPPHIGFYVSDELFNSNVKSIEIKSMPVKTVYAIGENFDRTGLVVEANYEDGTTKEIDSYSISGFDSSNSGEQTITISFLEKTATFKVKIKELSRIEIASPPTNTIVYQGGDLDTAGLVVKAVYEDGTSDNVSDYTLSNVNSSTAGTQAVTVTYKGKTATFDVTVKAVSSIIIAHEPINSVIYQGGTLDKTGLVVKALFDDGKSIEITKYSLSSYDSKKLGVQTITVTYKGKTATFDITVKGAGIEALNRVYETDMTQSSVSTLPIGSYRDDFTIEHTVKIDSMPANGSDNKDNMAGFAIRFMNLGTPKHTGGGWYLKASGEQALVVWKNTRTTNIGKITVGETYTFKYEFTNVAAGTGASLKLSIIDSTGNVVASQSNLNIRNFSDTDSGKMSPITAVEIYNQAKEGQTASVTFDSASVYSSGKITAVDGADITVNLASAAGMKLYAADYDGDGILTGIDVLTPEAAGESTLTAAFEPDMVFLWGAGVRPIDMWKATPITESTLTVHVTDSANTPVFGADVTLRTLNLSSGGDDDSGEEIEVMADTVTMTGTTDSSGNVTFTNVPVGRYRLTAKYGDGSILATKIGNVTLSKEEQTATLKMTGTLTAPEATEAPTEAPAETPSPAQ